jgi:hypothetical protein
MTWVRGVWQSLQAASRGVYSNFLGDEGEDRIREAYSGATFTRLTTLKAKYDPTNFFRLNQNITPAR